MPQGTVLASVLYVIMLLATDREGKEKVVRCFVDGTRVSKMMGSEDQKEKKNIADRQTYIHNGQKKKN